MKYVLSFKGLRVGVIRDQQGTLRAEIFAIFAIFVPFHESLCQGRK